MSISFLAPGKSSLISLAGETLFLFGFLVLGTFEYEKARHSFKVLDSEVFFIIGLNNKSAELE